MATNTNFLKWKYVYPSDGNEQTGSGKEFGLTFRELAAIHILQGRLASGSLPTPATIQKCVEAADALAAELANPTTEKEGD